MRPNAGFLLEYKEIIKTHTTDRLTAILALTGALLLTTSRASGELFTIPGAPPQNFGEIRTQVQTKIPDALNQAMCGGSITSVSVQGKVPTVNGVPGRGGVALGNILSGMARRIETGGARNDGFQFPGSTLGLSTTCDPGKLETRPRRWCRGPKGTISQCDAPVAHPFFQDPPCLWRETTATNSDGTTSRQPSEIAPPHNEEKCQAFCGMLNTYTYEDCRVPVQNPKSKLWTCAEWGRRYTCTDSWTTSTDPSYVPNRNCMACQGAACRCEGGSQCPIATSGNQKIYKSFFRKYTGSYSRNAVPGAKRDITQEIIPASCYGFYKEYDPKKKMTEIPDKRCALYSAVTDRADKMESRGQYGTTPALDPKPLERDSSFSIDDDLWFENLGGGMSLLNERVFERDFDSDLSKAILQLDTATQEAIYQSTGIDQQQQTVPKAYADQQIRAFDDSVSNERGSGRTVVEWWQRFEIDANRFFTPPTVRLSLPSTWAAGLDWSDPVFSEMTGPASAKPAGEAGQQTIEVQLKAGEDFLGQFASFLEKSAFARIQHEPIPVVVPLGSPTEFRANAQIWCDWWIWREARKNPGTPPPRDCSGATGEIGDLIQKLAVDYPEQIERYRELRAELPTEIGKILRQHQDVSARIGEWLKRNLETYKIFLEGRQERMNFLRQWNDIQQILREFHDDANQPWCRNDRFTTPIYSLLDPWLWGRHNVGSLTGGNMETCAAGDGLPRLCIPDGDKDLMIDLSTLDIGSGTIRIPVLEPVQVKLRLPKTPSVYEDVADPSTLVLPDLPPVPSLRGLIPDPGTNTLFIESEPADIALPGKPDFSQVLLAFDEARNIVQTMKQIYEEFWDSVQAFDPAFKQKKRQEDPGFMYCGTNPQTGQSRELLSQECCGWGVQNCVHTEMDLVERYTRIGARPGIFLREDFDSRSRPALPTRTDTALTCNPKDTVCPAILPIDESPSDGWSIRTETDTSGVNQLLETLRNEMRRETLQDDGTTIEGETPYDVTPEDLYPVYGIPRDINLRPDSSASSSSPTP